MEVKPVYFYISGKILDSRLLFNAVVNGNIEPRSRGMNSAYSTFAIIHHCLFQLVDIDECLSNTAFHLFLQTSLTTKVTMVFLMLMIIMIFKFLMLVIIIVFLMLVLIMVMIVLQTFLASTGSGLPIHTSQLQKWKSVLDKLLILYFLENSRQPKWKKERWYLNWTQHQGTFCWSMYTKEIC